MEKAHWKAEDEVKLCRDILAIEDPLSEDVVEISRKQEHMNASLEKKQKQMRLSSKVQEGFPNKVEQNCKPPSRSSTLNQSEREQSCNSLQSLGIVLHSIC